MPQPRPNVLLYHGFTGGPFELEPLARRLQSSGWETNIPLLPANSTHFNCCNVRYTDWIEAAEKSANDMVQRTGEFDLIGFSMGGLLAAYIANRYPVRRLVLLNAAIFYFSPGRLVKTVIEQAKKGDYSRIKKMRSTPFSLTWEFMKLAGKLYGEFARLQVPTLVIQSTEDPVIHPASARWLERTVKSCRKVHYFTRSGHTICLDQEREEVGSSVETFLLES